MLFRTIAAKPLFRDVKLIHRKAKVHIAKYRHLRRLSIALADRSVGLTTARNTGSAAFVKGVMSMS